MREDNRWVILSKKFPWEEIDREYQEHFKSSEGQVAIPSRLAFGALYIQAEEGYTDEQTRRNIQENPYLQYFCGFECYTMESPFDASMMTHFRKRISPEMIQKARQAGATYPQIQAALSGANASKQSTQQNRTAISDTASGRKELDSAMLAQVNPDVFQHRDSMTGRQTEYEIVWENDKFVRRPIPLVFGQEMFQNKNLTFAPNYNMATPPSYVLGAGDEIVVEVWGPSEFLEMQRSIFKGLD